MRRAVFSLLFLFFIYGAVPAPASAADCSNLPGTRPATTEDAAVKNGQIKVGDCYNPDDAGINQTSEEAKQELQNLRCSGGVNVQQLDSKFSTCANKFLKELRTVDSSACIISAYRSVQQQAAACQGICGNSGGCPGLCAPPGHSYHQRGLAVDMKSTVSNQQLWQIGAQSGLINPSGLHRSDPRHLQASSGTTCAALDVPVGDAGEYYNDTNKYFRPSPSLPFDQQARQALGMQQPPPPPPAPPAQSTPSATPAATTPTQTNSAQVPPTTDTLNTTPFPAGTCAPQTRCVQDDGNIYYRATTCVDQVYKKCPSGCTGLICNATSSSSNNDLLFSDTASTDTGDGSSNGKKATSTFDLIDFFANPTASTEIGTATPIDINQSIQDTSNAEVLGAAPPQGGLNTSGTGPTGGLSAGLSPQQTFTSADLSNSPVSYNFQQSSTFQQILAQMKIVLTNMIPYVTPFGGRVGVPFGV